MKQIFFKWKKEIEFLNSFHYQVCSKCKEFSSDIQERRNAGILCTCLRMSTSKEVDISSDRKYIIYQEQKYLIKDIIKKFETYNKIRNIIRKIK